MISCYAGIPRNTVACIKSGSPQPKYGRPTLSFIISKLHLHDDVIKWKHFLRYWPFVRGIHRSPVHSPHSDRWIPRTKGQWRGALMFSSPWINGWKSNRKAGDLRWYHAHYDVIVLCTVQRHDNVIINSLQCTHERHSIVWCLFGFIVWSIPYTCHRRAIYDITDRIIWRFHYICIIQCGPLITRTVYTKIVLIDTPLVSRAVGCLF